MAHIQEEFKNDSHQIVIEVLQPTKDEIDYGEMQIQVDWDHFESLNLEQFRKVAQWFNRMADYIELNFEKDGKPIRRKVVNSKTDMSNLKYKQK